MTSINEISELTKTITEKMEANAFDEIKDLVEDRFNKLKNILIQATEDVNARDALKELLMRDNEMIAHIEKEKGKIKQIIANMDNLSLLYK